MDREEEETLIDLGSASEETKGGSFGIADVMQTLRPLAILADD